LNIDPPIEKLPRESPLGQLRSASPAVKRRSR
jgi:hypothetical protein